jgi:hypothetical protein
MTRTLTIRLDEELSSWLKEAAARTGLSQGQIVRNQLEKARAGNEGKPYMRWAGSVKGLPRNLSSRIGFSKS